MPAWLITAGKKFVELWQVAHGWLEGMCPVGIGKTTPGASLKVDVLVWHDSQDNEVVMWVGTASALERGVIVTPSVKV
jgi:hypothetical protein